MAACTNPKCSCDPCGCTECKCGVTTLGDLERRVLEILWARPGADLSVRDVADQLHGYAYTTVATVLGRLTDKGHLTRTKVGRATRYTSIDSGSALAATVMHEALGSTVDTAATLAAFARTISPSEARLLRLALETAAVDVVDDGGSCH